MVEVDRVVVVGAVAVGSEMAASSLEEVACWWVVEQVKRHLVRRPVTDCHAGHFVAVVVAAAVAVVAASIAGPVDYSPSAVVAAEVSSHRPAAIPSVQHLVHLLPAFASAVAPVASPASASASELALVAVAVAVAEPLYPASQPTATPGHSYCPVVHLASFVASPAWPSATVEVSIAAVHSIASPGTFAAGRPSVVG